jgi:hypothetical protein
MLKPGFEFAKAYIEKICPSEEDQIYIDVLSIEDEDLYVENVILDFYTNEEDIEESILRLLLRSPYYVEWYTDSDGNDFRIVIIDHRQIGSLVKSLRWL